MAEEISFKNSRISKFDGLVTLTLTLDRVILHTISAPIIDLYVHAKYH